MSSSSSPVLVDVTTEYVVASVRGISHRLPWYMLRAAASQSDQELAAVYGRLLRDARRAARKHGLLRLEYATVDRAASSTNMDRLVEYASREWPGLLQRGIVTIEIDPDPDADPAGVVVS